MNKPRTISDFRSIGKRKISRKPSAKRAVRQQWESVPTTADEAKALHDARSNRKMADYKRTNKPTWRSIVDADNAFQHGKYSGITIIPVGKLSLPSSVDWPRAKNWRSPSATSGKTWERRVSVKPRGGWTSYEYEHHIESWGVVSPTGSKLYYQIHHASGLRKGVLKAPRGWKWNVDANGIRLRTKATNSGMADYHPSASEILNCSLPQLRKLARDNQAKRKALLAEFAKKEKAKQESQEAAERAIKRAESEGATVCLADSLRAGNCLAGTQQWASRHGFDFNRHYKPSDVLAKANGDTHRVALVVNVALRRHKLEMERGYADLEDHQIKGTTR